MKKYRTFNEIWDNKTKQFVLPDKCLAVTISNAGDDDLIVDDFNILKPGQSYSLPVINGYYIDGAVKLQYVNPTSLNNPRVIIRTAIEVE